MHIDELLEQARTVAAESPVHFPDHWGQGRTAFGGLTAAMLYSAMLRHVAAGRQLQVMNATFVGPLYADHPFYIETEVLREGKNISQIVARAVQDNQVAVVVQACFTRPRPSVVIKNAEQASLPQPVESGRPLPMIPGVTPAFTGHIRFSITEGEMPFTGSQCDKLAGWMRFADTPSAFTDAHLIALIDAWPPTMLQNFPQPAPASTVTWYLELMHPRPGISPEDWLSYQAVTRQAADGYGHSEASVHTASGELLAVSRQMVALFS